MTKVSDIFFIKSGNKFDYSKMQISNNSNINFVSRTSQNNGVVSKVDKISNVEPFPAGLITVSLGGTYLLSSFIQKKDFYTAQNVAVLIPKEKMTFQEKLFYCYAISENRFRYRAFGREANKTLKDIELPNKIPKWIEKYNEEERYLKTNRNFKEDIDFNNWKEFDVSYLFKIKRGDIKSIKDIEEGETPIVTAYGDNQGVAKYGNIIAEYENCITASLNGSNTGYFSYHGYKFNANNDCGVLIPLVKINKWHCLFLVTLLNLMSNKYLYGRKLTPSRLKNEKIKLPVDNEGLPDWKWIESYMKKIPYSEYIK